MFIGLTFYATKCSNRTQFSAYIVIQNIKFLYSFENAVFNICVIWSCLVTQNITFPTPFSERSISHSAVNRGTCNLKFTTAARENSRVRMVLTYLVLFYYLFANSYSCITKTIALLATLNRISPYQFSNSIYIENILKAT